MLLADLPAAIRNLLRFAARRPQVSGLLSLGKVAVVSRAETLCMVLGLGATALALGVTVAQATLPPVLQTEDALRRIVVQSGFDASICPDGWAADHAAMLPLTEAEVTAWYIAEATRLSDAEVIASVGQYVTQTKDFRQIEGAALTRNQILLCIAESRRLVTPLHERIPPELRSDVSAI